jgi:DNA-binding MarR family transcriptional regulator
VSRPELFATTLELLRLTQRRNRFVSKAEDSAFSLVESHIVVEIDASAELRAGDLVKRLRLDKSTISRALSSLRRRGLIQTIATGGKSRGAPTRLTIKGGAALAELDRGANLRMSQFCAALNAAEQRQLRDFFQLIGDGAEIESAPLRPVDHPIRNEIRRITRALGLLGVDVLHSGLSSIQWHALREIESATGDVSAQALSEILNVAPNTMSSLVAVLTRKGLVQRRRAAHDARLFNLRLSTEGQRALKILRAEAAALFERSFAKLADEELALSVGLLERFASSPEADPEALFLQTRRISSDAEFKQARVFALRELVRQGKEEEVGSTIAGQESLIWVLEKGSECLGIVEFQKIPAGAWVAALALTKPGAVNSRRHRHFVQQACRELQNSGQEIDFKNSKFLG